MFVYEVPKGDKTILNKSVVQLIDAIRAETLHYRMSELFSDVKL